MGTRFFVHAAVVIDCAGKFLCVGQVFIKECDSGFCLVDFRLDQFQQFVFVEFIGKE